MRRVKIFFGDNLEAVENIGHHALAFFSGQVFVGERQVDVLGDSEIVKQVIALEDHADALAGKIGALLAVERWAGVSPNQYSPSQPSSSRASTLSSDDFPAPDGPITVTNSLSLMVSPMRRSTQVSVWPVL